MSKIKSKLIQGTKPNAETIAKLQELYSIPPDKSLAFMVFEVRLERKKIYCCWAGGEIEDGEVKLTPIGQAALEALLNLPMGDNETLRFQELKLGQTPLKAKVRQAVKRFPANAKVCFIGDMQGELDGHMHKAFNVQNADAGIINVSH